jgi:RNA polymerase sigma factor (TIGR02999 family)
MAATDVTGLLRQWQAGDAAALDKVTPLVADALHRLAHRYMSRERAGHVLQTTALVNEAFVRLVGSADPDWQDRSHFFAVAAQVMRHALVDYARQHTAAKRGSTVQRVTLDAQAFPDDRADEVVALEDGLSALRKLHPRATQVVELRYFAGFNNKEVAKVLNISEATVERDWRFAKAWLYRELRA